VSSTRSGNVGRQRRSSVGCSPSHDVRDGSPLLGDVVTLQVFFEGPSNDNHEIDSWSEEVANGPERLTHEPLGSIPDHGRSHFPRSDDTEPGLFFRSALPCGEQQDEVRRRHSPPRVLNGAKFAPFADPLTRGEGPDGAQARHATSGKRSR